MDSSIARKMTSDVNKGLIAVGMILFSAGVVFGAVGVVVLSWIY